MLSRFGWVMVSLMLVVVALFAATTRVISVAPAPTEAATPASERLMTFGTPDRVDQPATLAAKPDLLTVPVADVSRSALKPNFGDPRGEGGRTHEGLDIMAPQGAPVVAAAPGTIEKLYFSEGGGGITIYERSSDGKTTYYYAHLDRYAPGLHEGQKVKAGEWIASVGDSGNAGVGNYHLHFAVSRMGPKDGWWQGTPVDPYPLLVGTTGPS
ncbi:M23 family metallopeptidase [Stakelama marina]|uniref:M23 family metallopeptidase n=1 Tax=Stakelama marina TaxID=2826939 RepID=A0A8T4I9X8_9SPHN|nr:M23 family metallopeptidase [Stakelama marina]MBR0551457.1 M23 family metallopeptidase [Stakelama marina]